jgi:ATP-dependent DNA helicase RecQ
MKDIPESTIVYCRTKEMVQYVHKVITTRFQLNARIYSSDLTTQQRHQVYQEFIMDKVPIIVATIAFGMGIDKPDVLILH